MYTKVTIRTLSLILILTMLFSLSGCAQPTEEVEIPPTEETILVEIPPTEETEPVPEEDPIKPGYIPKNVPLYNQKKYPHTPYDTFTVSTDGCGITCAAMVISYLTEYTVMPDYLALNYNLRPKTNEQRMIKALHDFNIEVVEEYYGKKDWKNVYQALEEGHLVISLQGAGLFTTKSHFILLTGLTEDGRITVNDPNGSNYKVFNDELRKGFKNGFEDVSIWRNGGNYYVLEFTGCFVPFGIKPTPYSHTVTAPL